MSAPALGNRLQEGSRSVLSNRPTAVPAPTSAPPHQPSGHCGPETVRPVAMMSWHAIRTAGPTASQNTPAESEVAGRVVAVAPISRIPTSSRIPHGTAPESQNRSTVPVASRSEEHTSELQSRFDLVCRLLLEKKNNTT